MPSGTPRYFVFPPLNAVKQASSRVFFSPTLFLQVASQLTDMITRFLQLVWKQPTPLKVSCVCVCVDRVWVERGAPPAAAGSQSSSDETFSPVTSFSLLLGFLCVFWLGC